MQSAALLVLASAAVTAPASPWTDRPVAEAMAAAKRQGRPLMIDVYATWCGPCQKLDKDVFPDPAVQAEAAHYVAVKVDGETPEGERLKARYHVVGYPTVLFLDPSGAEIDRVFGYKPAAEFAAAMADYRAGRNTVEVLQRALKRNPTDLDLALKVGRRLAIRGDRAEAERLLGRVRAADADNARGLAAQALLVLGKYLHLRGGKRHDRALALLSELRSAYPKSPEARRALYPLARAFHGLGRDAEALAALQAGIDADPTDIGAYNTFAWFCFKQNVDRPQGIAVAKRGLAVDPKAAGLWDTLAELHHATGDRAAALAAIDRAIALHPDDAYFLGQRGRFAQESGDRG